MEPDKTENWVRIYFTGEFRSGDALSAGRTSEESPWPVAVPWTIHWWLPLNAARPTVLPKQKHRRRRH